MADDKWPGKMLFYLVFFILVLSPSLVAWNGKEYYFSDVKINWSDAQKLCVARGGTLAKILSKEEDDFMSNQLNKRFDYFNDISHKFHLSATAAEQSHKLLS